MTNTHRIPNPFSAGIALRVDTTERALQRVNTLLSDSVHAGQRLVLPARATTAPTSPAPSSSSPSSTLGLQVPAQKQADVHADAPLANPNQVSLEAEGRLVEVVGKNGIVKQVWRAGPARDISKPPQAGAPGSVAHSYHSNADAAAASPNGPPRLAPQAADQGWISWLFSDLVEQ